MSTEDKTKLNGIRNAWTKIDSSTIMPGTLSTVAIPIPNPYTKYNEMLIAIGNNCTTDFPDNVITCVVPLGVSGTLRESYTKSKVIFDSSGGVIQKQGSFDSDVVTAK